jgi:NADH-quinone oxidoreductase subunit B
MPVDVYVPGCPPRPDAFMEGLVMLRDFVGKEKRPLSWVIGPQGVEKSRTQSMKEIKREERMKTTILRPPTEI